MLLNLTLMLVCGISYCQVYIQGNVISEITNKTPISEIYITVLKDKKPTLKDITMTDNDGFFIITDLEPNKFYKIKLSAFAYKDQIVEIKTNNGITNVILNLNASCEYSAKRAEKDWKNENPKLLLFGSIAPIGNSASDTKFEKKYGIEYFDFGCEPPIQECIKVYNERIFELMDKSYGRKWRRKVRSDVEYLK